MYIIPITKSSDGNIMEWVKKEVAKMVAPS